MITRTPIGANIGPKTPISLRAEVLLLVIITIFGIIGLSFCIGLYSPHTNSSAELNVPQEIEISSYDRKVET